MLETSDYLASLVHDTSRSEEEVLAQAVKTGLREMWRQQLLGRYLRGELDRAAVVDQVGLDLVELAERQSQAVQEDLAWARQAN
ncbi:MAG TPA: hypothetical protein VGI40_22535 [Pirellulaceae bacterium]|jgi:hypothetical protein